MNLKDDKYKSIRKYIIEQYNEYNSWDDVKNVKQFRDAGFKGEELYSIVGINNQLGPEGLNKRLWIDLVNDVKKEIEINKPVIMGENVRSEVNVPSDKFSSWRVYIDNLTKKGWPESARINIESSALKILERLSQDTKGREANKGLVVGDVQSGKTANMAGLMAMAADHGYNFFIILSGVIENLRQQTSDRLYKDLVADGSSSKNWRPVNKPSLKSPEPDHNISNYNLHRESKDVYFTVCLKNSKRLKDLNDWLFSDKNKVRQLKVLVIDDEADQASINTKNINVEQSTINSLIKKIVNNKEVRAMNYIAYTATPYANVLNETGPDSLYPKDFITVLPMSKDYIGADKLFGIIEPEKDPALDIVRIIRDEETEYVKNHSFNGRYFPDDLSTSINWFLISLSIGRILELKQPISMLVHTSMKIADHQSISKLIRDYLQHVKNNYNDFEKDFKRLYIEEKQKLSRDKFLNGMPGYSNKEKVMEYPSWEKVKIELEKIFCLRDEEFLNHIDLCDNGRPVFHNGIHLVIDNSSSNSLFDERENIRLVYPKDDKYLRKTPGFIVIGGNTLSRGLTLEGLSSTYFLRNTHQVDTLMQMGRWFGYRKGYELLPRIWLDYKTLLRFIDISQINEELREEIKTFSENEILPVNYALRVKNSSNHKLLSITSNNKMQSAVAKDFNFIGFNSQTIYFKKDKEELLKNLENTKNFLNRLNNKVEVDGSHMIWRDVESDKVAPYLNNFIFNENDLKMRSIPQLVEWILDEDIELDNWNIVLSSKKGIQKDPSYKWSIHGYKTVPVSRSKIIKRSTDEVANIGALRTPSDLFADIKRLISKEEKDQSKPSEVINIRNKYGHDKTPLLVIYRIDSGIYSISNKSKKKEHREPLDFPVDVIGLNILIPGRADNKSFTTYISADIKFNDVDEEFIEEDEE